MDDYLQPAQPRTLSWSEGALTLALLPTASYSARDPVRHHTLGIAMERQRGVHAIDSDRRADFDTWPGTLAYTPAGMEVFSESSRGGEYLLVRWHEAQSPALPRRRIEQAGHGAAFKLARRIRAIMLAAVPDMMALEEMATYFTTLRDTPARHCKPFDHPAMSRVLDRIAAEFSEPLTLATLADTYGSPALRLLRDFALATGMTPHSYVQEVRLRQVRRLLRHTPMPLADIAADCGFAHQSHMGAVFLKELGTTPRRYRA